MGRSNAIEEERNRSSVKILCQTASTSFLPANLTLFNEKHELNCCFDDLSHFFPLRWTWKPYGIYSFAALQEQALGQTWIMSSSPGVSQQVMLVSKADSKLALTSLELYCAHEGSWQVSAYFPCAHPMAQASCCWARHSGAKGKGKQLEKYSK